MENQTAGTTYDGIPTTSVESNKRGKTEADHQEYQEALITVPPDGGWGWVVVVGGFFSFLIVDGIFCSFGVFLEKMSEDLKCSKSQVSLSTAITSGVFCLSGPFSASLVNNYGYQIVGVVGSIITIISCLITSLFRSIYLIYFSYGVVAGVGLGMINMPAVIAIGFYFEKRRGIATGIAACGGGLGGVVLPIAFSVTLDRFGWRQTFRILSTLFLVTLLCSLLFKPVPPSRVQRIKLNPVVSGNFFNTYHNRMYPTLSELTEVPTTILLQSRKFRSSEIMITNYPSSSIHFKAKEKYDVEEPDFLNCMNDEILEDTIKQESKAGSEFQSIKTRKEYTNAASDKLTTTAFVSKKFMNQMRPMYRDDIFYNSSFNFLQKYKRTEPISSQKMAITKSKSNIDYHIMSVTRMPTHREVDETTGCRRALCTDAVKRTLATMLDYKLLKSPTFLLIALNAAFVCLGYLTIYVFIEDRVRLEGLTDDFISWLIPIIGVANIAGRIIGGFITTCPRMSCTLFSAFCLIVGGFATIVSVHFNNIGAQICYAVIFGSFIACIPVLRTLIIVDTLGLDKLTNAVGLTLIFQGVASLAGLSIAGLLKDVTGNYNWSFYFSGATVIIAALFFIPLQKVATWERNEKEKDAVKQNRN